MTALSPRTLTIAAFVLALAAIAGAWGFQLIGGFMPCELCYLQRWPYYFGVPLLAVTLLVWSRAPRGARMALVGVAAALFVWSTYLGGYHAGVEWGFWPGPDSCTGLGGGTDFSSGLSNLDDATFVPCDRPQFPLSFLPISFAAFNALVSLAVAAMLAWSTMKLSRRQAG